MNASSNTSSINPSADYGIDAPGVVRNLLIAGVIAWLVLGGIKLGIVPTVLVLPLPGISLSFPLLTMGIGFGILMPGVAAWMIWDSKIGKLNSRDKLLAQIAWTGQEQVLDVGCGRGLMLIGAAKRLTTGKATGIDIWNNEDLSGNNFDATMENVRREGVADRIELETADMRKLPFADNSFDLIVSRAAIHNVYNRNERAAVIAELTRVLKPGGQAIIEDIRYITEYAADFKKNGCADIRRLDSLLASLLTTLITTLSLRPGALLVRKAK
jgi:SAM-dependent methyltransferase